MSAVTPTEAKRLASVDALRGIAVAAMLLVNDPGDWGHVFAPLEHAEWHGCTPTDLVFPFFLFIVGVSIALSMGPRLDRGAAPAPLVQAVLRRASRIVVFGLVLHALAWWLMHKPEFRPMGVLQRIGLCFGLAGWAAIKLRARGQWTLIVALLLGYWALLFIGGAGADPYAKVGNLVSRVDTAVLGRFAYVWDAQTGMASDPEGLLSTLGALATTLLGLRAGDALRRGRIKSLLVLGAGAAVLGLAWSTVLPLNKQLWTSSYVLWTAGLAALGLLAAHQWVDVWHRPAWGQAFGRNAIAVYGGAWMATVLLEGFGWAAPLYHTLFDPLLPWLGLEGQSLAYAVGFVAVWWLVARLLDAKAIYLKL